VSQHDLLAAVQRLSLLQQREAEEKARREAEEKAKQAAEGARLTSNPFAALEPLLDAVAPEPEEGHDKMLTDVKYFKFGDAARFLQGFDAKLTRAMKTEFETNDNGRWWGEFLYVTRNGAITVCPT
jgi:hypothetical protein